MTSTPLAKRYVSGWCGVHITQYQKNEGPSASAAGNADYRLTVTLYDALQDVVGGVSLLDAPGGVWQNIDSQLPDVFEVVVGGNDADALELAYSGQLWSSAAAQCGFGVFADGSRNMDCGFNC